MRSGARSLLDEKNKMEQENGWSKPEALDVEEGKYLAYATERSVVFSS